MNNKTMWVAIIIILVIASYTAIFFLGRGSVKKAEPKIEIKETIKYDTVSTIKKIFVNRYSETKTAGDSVKSYSDSIMGDTLGTKYQIQHTISDSQKTIRSWWKVDIEPRFRTITKYITKDSIQTKVNTEYVSLPFFLNPHFYGEIVLTILLIVSLIFQ